MVSVSDILRNCSEIFFIQDAVLFVNCNSCKVGRQERVWTVPEYLIF